MGNGGLIGTLILNEKTVVVAADCEAGSEDTAAGGQQSSLSADLKRNEQDPQVQTSPCG
jgi:hypothetical protein